MARKSLSTFGLAALVAMLAAAGCQSRPMIRQLGSGPFARELNMVSHPSYVVEPPDILLIDLINPVPRPPYRAAPLDTIRIFVQGNLPEAEMIGADFVVQAEGTIDLGAYGTIDAIGKTLDELEQAVEALVLARFPNAEPRVFAGLVSAAPMQQVVGEHLVRADGTVGLGTYGSVYVAGLTLDQVRAAVASHLSNFFLDPQVSVDVLAYNSKVYYVIFDNAGAGESIVRLPSTGNETVLDAIGQTGGLTAVSHRDRIWVARPAPYDSCESQILPVNWTAISRYGDTTTNYQIMPGDRIYVDSDPFIRLDAMLARVTAPVERAIGATLLGSITVRQLEGQGFGGGGRGGRGGF